MYSKLENRNKASFKGNLHKVCLCSKYMKRKSKGNKQNYMEHFVGINEQAGIVEKIPYFFGY